MRHASAASIALSIFALQTGAANAQWASNNVPPPFHNVEIRCGAPGGMFLGTQGIPNAPDGTSRIDIRAFDNFWPNASAYEAVILNPAALTRQLDTIRTGVHTYCESIAAATPNWDTNRGAPGIPDFYLISFHYTTRGDVLAYAPSLTDGWTILDNSARVETLRQHTYQKAQVAAVVRANQQAQSAHRQKLAAQKRFYSQFGVSQWVQMDQLLANPFVFKGKVIGVKARFVRMISETDALFSFGSTIVVSNVPPTLFRGGEDLVLAVKVLGLRNLQGATTPNLRFVGVHSCLRDCNAEIWPG